MLNHFLPKKVSILQSTSYRNLRKHFWAVDKQSKKPWTKVSGWIDCVATIKSEGQTLKKEIGVAII